MPSISPRRSSSAVMNTIRPTLRCLILFTSIEGVALIAYVFAGDFVSALENAVICGLFEQGANSTRSAIIARAFEGESRVHARAVLRTVTNVSIAVGSGLAAWLVWLGATGVRLVRARTADRPDDA